MMLVEQMEQWIGCEVVDPGGDGIGRLTEVFFRGSEPVLVTVRGGRLSRKRRLVPLEGASASRRHLRVAFAADRLIETRSGDAELSAQDLAAVAEHYGAAHTAEPGELEGSRARAERLQATVAAERQAAALETEAQTRATAADDAELRAAHASEEARMAQDERRRVTARAEAAREAARRL